MLFKNLEIAFWHRPKKKTPPSLLGVAVTEQDLMLVVSGPPTLHPLHPPLFTGNGNSSPCVKSGNNEYSNCFAHFSGVPFKDHFKPHWLHFVGLLPPPHPSHSQLYGSLLISHSLVSEIPQETARAAPGCVRSSQRAVSSAY